MDNQVRAALIGFGGMGRIYAKMIYAGMVPGLVLTGFREADWEKTLLK